VSVLPQVSSGYHEDATEAQRGRLKTWLGPTHE